MKVLALVGAVLGLSGAFLASTDTGTLLCLILFQINVLLFAILNLKEIHR
jgi:uncharacterized membrane protein YtjA (UPF0391 family)